MIERDVQKYFTDVIQKLWPRWEVNDFQFKTWAGVLMHLDYNAASRAAKEHYVTRDASFGSPKIHAIIELARKYQPKKAFEAKLSDYVPSVFVQCIEHKDLIKLYQFFAIYVARQKQNDTDYILQAAECTRKRVEALYGGHWIIIQQTNHDQMHRQLIEYRCGAEFKKYKEKLAEESVPKRYKFTPEPELVGG